MTLYFSKTMESNKNNITIQLMGGLGNMLFQIAASFATSLRDNKNFYCDVNMNIVPHLHYKHYQDNILRKISFKEKNDINHFYNEINFSFDEIPLTNGNTELKGYFQSEKYFKNYRNEILKLFEPDSETKNKVDNFFHSFKDKLTCSIHVRRNDYIHLSQYHHLQDIEYYKLSVDIIGNNREFLIFSDDIQWCKENFNFIENKTFIEDFKDFEEIYLMSKCDDNIIANSTFSWWGAWLNENKNKQVILPSKWFGVSNSNLNTNDVYCEKWIKL
jgi:hypothetical protein